MNGSKIVLTNTEECGRDEGDYEEKSPTQSIQIVRPNINLRLEMDFVMAVSIVTSATPRNMDGTEAMVKSLKKNIQTVR
jgi:hypothetical protein